MSVLTAEAIFNPFVELETVDLYSRDLDTADVYYLGDMNPYDSGSSLYVRQSIRTARGRAHGHQLAASHSWDCSGTPSRRVRHR